MDIYEECKALTENKAEAIQVQERCKKQILRLTQWVKNQKIVQEKNILAFVIRYALT